MTRFNDYVNRYPQVALERTDSGVLTMRIHRDGGPAKWAALEGSIHEQIGDAVWHAGRDGAWRRYRLGDAGGCEGALDCWPAAVAVLRANWERERSVTVQHALDGGTRKTTCALNSYAVK